MGFLFFSVDYPTSEVRTAYLQEILSYGKSFTTTTMTKIRTIPSSWALYEPLPASADDQEWKSIVTLLQRVCSDPSSASSSSSFLQQEQLRPLKPNDDNYLAFVGPQWKRLPNMTKIINLPTELSAFQPRDDEPTPHFDHCAYCTQPEATKRCGKCKIVAYCSRDCQMKHWTSIHRKSCIPAESRTLWKALHTNDGFHITVSECHQLATTLHGEISNRPTDEQKVLVQRFALYFHVVTDLGGCFVL